MSDFRVLVTGSRHVTPDQRSFVRHILTAVHQADRQFHGPRTMMVVHGACPQGGVDLVAEEWALETERADHEPHPADRVAGTFLGPQRNSYMVNLGAQLCLAFPTRGSRGTWDCLRKAVDAGIPSRLYPLHILVPKVVVR